MKSTALMTRAAVPLMAYSSVAIALSDGHGGGGSTLPLQGWSSIIGIVTAIVGNVFISFALNIQRYAHIRLSKEQRQDREWKSGDLSQGKNSYGTDLNGQTGQDVSSLDTRGKDHDTGETGQGSIGDYNPTETDPLTRPSGRSTLEVDADNEYDGDESAKTYLKSPYWWAGILLMTIGEVGNFLAYGFAPASIVSPLGVVALVSNCVIAPILLKERFRLRDFIGVVVAIGGAVTIVLSAKTSETKLGPHEIGAAITRWEFELYLGITVCLILVGMWASNKYGETTVLIDLSLVALFGKLIYCVEGLTDGYPGGYTALSTKGVASMLSYTLWHALTFPITYALLFVLISTALLQIKYVNRALQRFDSTQVIPTQFVLFTISVIVGSAILYRDFEQATPTRMLKFLSGCVLTFLGVYLITSGRKQDDEGVAQEDGEDTVNRVSQQVGAAERGDQGTGRPTSPETSEQGTVRRKNDSVAQSNLPDPIDEIASRRSSTQCPPGPSKSPSINLSSQSASEGLSGTSLQSDHEPLLDNPWQSDRDRLALPRPSELRTTESSPLLPSESNNYSDGPATPRPALESQHDQYFNETPSLRPSTLSRRSISRMLPGPYISPLSSSLSAVVADSLRRAADSSPTRRRIGDSLRGAPSRLNLTDIERSRSHRVHGPASSETDLSPINGHDPDREAAHQSQSGQRPEEAEGSGRSFSSALGDLFRGRRAKKKAKDDGVAGP